MINIDLETILLIISFTSISLLILGFWFIFLRKPQKPKWKIKLEKKYQEFNTKNINNKYAVIELDKLIEYGLQIKFNTKKSLGKILIQQKKFFKKEQLDNIWKAHKLRNKLIHDAEFEAQPNDINHANVIFKRMIKELIK